MTYELGRSLLLTEAVTPDDLARALFAAASEGAPLVRALVAVGAITHDRLDQELARAEVPVVKQVVAVPDLLRELPTGLCSRLLAVPIRRDARTGTVDVAVADARDPHPAAEIGFFLKAPVRVVRAPLRAIEAALDRTTTAPAQPEALAPPIWVVQRSSNNKHTPIWGTPVPRTSTIPPPPRAASVPPPPFSKAPSAFPPPASANPLSSATSALSSIPPPIPLMRRATARPPSSAFDDEPVLELRAVTMRKAPGSNPPSTSPYGARPPDTVRDSVPPVFSLGPMPMRIREPPNAPPQVFADPAALLASIRGANTRDEIMQLLMLGIRAVARKGALFVVKKDAYVGWTCTPELADEARLRDLRIPTKLPSVFASAAAGKTYLGPVFASEAHDQLLAVIGAATTDVAVTAVRVSGHPAVLMLADELADTMIGTYRMEEVARAAGETLTRILKRGR